MYLLYYRNYGNILQTGSVYIYSRESRSDKFNQKERLEGASWRDFFCQFGEISSDGLNLVVGVLDIDYGGNENVSV